MRIGRPGPGKDRKMTFTIKSETINGIHIAIEQEKYSVCYRVSAYIEQKSGLCGYPITSLIYTDIKSAKRRYSNLKRKAVRGEI